jgi:hypothetical protein
MPGGPTTAGRSSANPAVAAKKEKSGKRARSRGRSGSTVELEGRGGEHGHLVVHAHERNKTEAVREVLLR